LFTCGDVSVQVSAVANDESVPVLGVVCDDRETFTEVGRVEEVVCSSEENPGSRHVRDSSVRRPCVSFVRVSMLEREETNGNWKGKRVDKLLDVLGRVWSIIVEDDDFCYVRKVL
jgi:hypothetical protein